MKIYANIDSFHEDLINELKDKLGDDKVISKKVIKNNGETFHGITVALNGSYIMPTTYTEYIWEDYSNGKILYISEAADILIDELKNHVCPNINMEILQNAESVKDNVMFKVGNYEMNGELLKTIPHRKYLDLAVMYYVGLDEKLTLTHTLTNEEVERLGITEEELFERAYENTRRKYPYSIKNLMYYLMSMDGEISEEDEEIFGADESYTPMYMVTNSMSYFGAAGILYKNMLDEFCKKKNINSIYIIPSSIHEVLLIIPMKSDEICPEDIAEIVKHVNATEVTRQEVLSNSVYKYSTENKEICITV